MAAIRSLLSGAMLQGVLLPASIDALLSALDVTSQQAAGPGVTSGTAQLGAQAHPLFFDLSLAPFGPAIPFRLTARPDGFDLALDLGQTAPLTRFSDLAADSAGRAFEAAAYHGTPGGEEWLTGTGGKVKVTGAALVLLMEGRRGAQATMRLAPSMDEPEGVVVLRLDPPTVLLGSSGFGLELSDGFVIDMSAEAAAPPAVMDGAPVALPGDAPPWKGLTVRKARLYLPESVPLFGRTAVDLEFEIGLAPPGIALSAEGHAPARADRPAMAIRIECMDPTATGLGSFIPTLVEAAIELPLNGRQEQVPKPGGGTAPLQLLAGTPVTARARFSRETVGPALPTLLAIGIEAAGENGVLAVNGSGGLAPKGFIAAGAFATALIAEQHLGSAGAGTAAAALITAGMALSTLMNDQGRLVVHGVELATEGKPKGLALTDKQTFTLDYSVDVVIRPIDIGVMSVALAPEQPLRIRLRGVVLALDHTKSGLGMVGLDFEHATMEVEDPGRWLVNGPGSLFDVLGSRSGRGSIWIEVDLRFKLDLGPIRVSGATIRATLDPATGKIGASIRGLDASIVLPGVIEGEGKVTVSDNGFEAMISVAVVPVGFNAEAFVRVESPMVLMELAADLPGPLPLANSGLGLYGVGGTFGIAAAIAPPAPNQDPVEHALLWDPQAPGAFNVAPGNFSFGLEAVIGTLPDMGFAFSAKAGLFLTVPDLVVLGALDASILSGRVSITHRPDPDPTFIALRGAIIVDPADAVTFGISGTLNIPVLMRAHIPSGGHFPVTGDLSQWYLYIGADGYSGQGRGIGPATIRLLPDILDQGAYGYFMLRGDGIEKWPRGGPQSFAGFVLAFGFGLELRFGPRPVVWAEVNASADILVATNPLVLAGFGHVDGAIHIGPVSVGVSADLTARVAQGETSLHARVCGHVNLLLTKIRKCVELTFGSDPPLSVPPPEHLPLDRIEGTSVVGQNASAIDDGYHQLAELPQAANGAPTVWPDALISLTFAWPPKLVAGLGGAQFPTIDQYPEGDRARPFGSNLLDYQWELRGLALYDVTGDAGGAGSLVPGAFSAAWQAGRSGDPGGSAEPAELVLFDTKGTFFVDRLADAGQSLPHDPIGAQGEICRPAAWARRGWTLGLDATAQEGWWRLPPELVSADPLQSRVAGVLSRGFGILNAAEPTPLDSIGLQQLPPMTNHFGAQVVTFPAPVTFELAFSGALLLDHATAADGDELTLERLQLRFYATLYFDEPVASEATLFLWAGNRAFDGKGPALVRVYDPKAPDRPWSPTLITLDDGQLVLTFKITTSGASAVRIEWPATQQIGILGFTALTASALAAAQARNAAQAGAAATQAQAAAAGPLTAAAAQSASSRCLLKPGRTYRLDVEMGWTGTLYQQVMLGLRVPAATATSDDPGMPPARRSYFFRTAPVHHTPAGGGATGGGGPVQSTSILKFGMPNYLQTLYRAQDTFAPELLERHLRGYEPGQSEVARFRRDPLRAHFGVGHVPALAGLYGYALDLGLRRIDTAAPSGTLALLGAAVSVALNPSFLTPADQRRYQTAAGVKLVDGAIVAATSHPCPIPKPGLTLDGDAELEPRAWYEVFVHIASTSGGAESRLPGVTFQTSRWFAPADMLADLGFPAATPGTATGDLEIRAISGFPRGSVLGDDSAFDAAMAVMGLDGWPRAETVRTSLLWLPRAGGAAWDLAGVLLESPEPIHRAGRCTVDGVQAVLEPGHAAVAFNTRFSDRSGSRLLFLTGTPFVPASWFSLGTLLPGGLSPPIGGTGRQSGPLSGPFQPGPRLVRHEPALRLSMTDLRPDGTLTSLTGLLALPTAPLFAGEAR